jgi:hypothetical protein
VLRINDQGITHDTRSVAVFGFRDLDKNSSSGSLAHKLAIRETVSFVNIVLEVRDNESLMCSTDRENDPTVMTMTKRKESICVMGTDSCVMGTDSCVMGTDSCMVTSGHWYRTHAERGSRERE